MSNVNDYSAEDVILVDLNDRETGTAKRAIANAGKFLYRCAVVMLTNDKNQLLIHKRSEKKINDPLCWDIFVGGAVGNGETYQDAVERETYEEVGLKNIDFKFLFKHVCKTKVYHGMVVVYAGKINGPLKLNADEVIETAFIDVNNFRKEAETRTFLEDNFQLMERYFDEIKH
jgi:isopentenyldiphosphate isomerase